MAGPFRFDGARVIKIDGADALAPLVTRARRAETGAVAAAGVAAAEADRADLAASGAVAAANLFPTTAAGLAATADGGFFTTIGDGAATYAILYQKVGSAAVEQARYASKAAYEGPAGADLIGFQHPGSDEVQSARDALRDWVSVMRFIPRELHAGIRDGTGTTPVHTYIQKAIDSLMETGGIVGLPLGIYHTTDTITMRSGVSLRGSGRYYTYTTKNVFTGSWIRYRGAPPTPALTYFNVAHISTTDLGVDCGEAPASVGIYLGSDNAPATKLLNFERLGLFGCATAVRWGNESLLEPLEQVDDISFREINCNSCPTGFVVNAANAADFSIIERASFYSCSGTAVKLVTPGFMRISECAAGSISPNFIMFDVAGLSPDPVVIAGCQSEGVPGKFLRYTANNDQSQIELRGNVINEPVEMSGLVRVTSRNNFINTTVTTAGFVRWRSDDDVWDGVFNQPPHIPQIIIGSGGQFFARTLRNASGYNGYYLPVGFRIEDGAPMAGGYEGRIVVQPGIVTTGFIPNGDFPAGSYVAPTVGNGHAYVATVGGIAGPEPTWPTASGGTVTTGAVTFKEVGPSAILRGYGLIQA